MSAAVFSDNTVLCNFAAVGRTDLLAVILRGRGRWAEAVAYEAERSSRYLPDLRRITQGGWLGEIDDPKQAEQIERIRRAVGPCSTLRRAATRSARGGFGHRIWPVPDCRRAHRAVRLQE